MGIHDITDEFIIEKEAFKWYENNLESIIQKILNRQTYLYPKDAEILCKGLLNIKIRNNYFRDSILSKENIGDFLDSVLKDFPLIMQENKDVIGLIEKMKIDFAKNPNLINQLQNKSLLDNNTNDDRSINNIYDLCINSQWTILETTINNMFITSDNPGFCIDENNLLENTKFGDSFTWYFPLTPFHCLRVDKRIKETTQSLKPLHFTDADSETVKSINLNTCQLANADIYSLSSETLLKNWIEFKKSQT